MICKSDFLLKDMDNQSFEVCVTNEKVGNFCIGVLKQTDNTVKKFEDVLSDEGAQDLLRKVKKRGEKHVYILVRSAKEGIKYKYILETEEIEKVCEIEPCSPDESFVKFLIEREIEFRKAHRRRLIGIIGILCLIFIIQIAGGTPAYSYIALGIALWITIYKWLFHIVHEKSF